MAVTVSRVWQEELGTNGITQLAITATDVTMDSSYATGGESVSAANLGLASIIWAQPAAADGYTFEFDHANAKLIAYGGNPGTPGIVDDSDTASTAGADLQIAISDHVADAIEENGWNGVIGRFEAINGGNADVHTNQVGTAVAATNPTFSVWDNDNAETETAVMADVYVAPAGGGFYAVTLSGLDTYVPLSNGEFIKVTYDADPATNQSAVQVYYDHDATNANERLLATVADNADETFTTASEVSLKSPGQQVSPGTDLSSVTTRVLAYGPGLA